jgi:DNA-binding transcriptional LysR family regulator
MEVSLTKLRHLAAVAKFQSFSRAAEELGISQPALSRSIAFLEQRYGVKVFERGRLGVTPTAAGIPILREVAVLLQNASDVDKNLMLYGRGDLGSVSFGVSPQLASILLKLVALEIHRRHPNASLRSVVRSAPDLLTLLLADEIEFFVCFDTVLEPEPELDLVALGAERVGLFVRGGHCLADKPLVTRADLASTPFATAVDLPSDGRGTSGFLVCDNYNILREIVFESNFVFACVRSFAEADVAAGRLVELKVRDDRLEPRTAYVVKRKLRALSPIAGHVIEEARRILLNSA